jgi:hypothetical protein
MKLKTYMAGAVLAGFLGASDLPAQQIQFKTMELHSIGGLSEEPVYVDVVHRRHHRRKVYHSHYVVKRRSKAHSAAIVGGSAAGGALIGGLAGGGKGAAIGAVAGGGAGYLYDRKTHKKVVRVE